MTHPRRLLAPAVVTALVVSLAGCSSDDSGGDGDGSTTLRIATVDNPDLERLREFSDAFTNEHPDVTIDWVVQDENRIR